MNPFKGLLQSFYLDFEWLLSSFDITDTTPLADTSSSEAAIRKYGKILND